MPPTKGTAIFAVRGTKFNKADLRLRGSTGSDARFGPTRTSTDAVS